MLEARRLEQQGELVEAIWCYETVLRDPDVTRQQPMLRAASLGLGLLLINEARTSEDARRTERLVNRAISVLTFADTHQPNDAELGLTLAQAHAQGFALRGLAKDLLAANMLLDTIAERDQGSDSAVVERAKALRTRLIGDRGA